MQSFISSQGGFLLAVGAIVFCLNLLFSAIAAVCNRLKITENPTLVKAGTVVGSVNSWLSANTPSVAPPAAQVQNPTPPKAS